MPDSTPILNLPYILPSQAQKHVTHNEAIRLLDVIVQLSVTARNLSTPPGAPAQGDRYIVPAGASGAWVGQGGKIALFENGAWQFFTPLAGWTAWVTGEQVLASYTGSAWASQADGPFNVGQLGISATPDAVNRLAVSSPATLLNHAGAGHQVKINKAAAGDTASLLFQTGFSGRAEMGTMGSDDFAVKVSADGSAFVTGLSIAAATGQVTLPAAARLGGQAADPTNPPNGTIWLNSTTGEVKLRSAGATVVIASGASGLVDGDKGDITVSAGGTVWAIDAGAVGNAKMAAMPSATFKARVSAGTGAPEDITPADAAGLLPVFTASAKGVVPASGGGTSAYLRADGSWAGPSAGYARASSSSVLTLTAVIPFDNTVPQITEGTQVASVSITPAKIGNKLHVTVHLPMVDASSPGVAVVAALFRDAVASAVASGFYIVPTLYYAGGITFDYEFTATALTSTTFTLRVGPHTTATAFVGQYPGINTLGGSCAMSVTVQEIAQ